MIDTTALKAALEALSAKVDERKAADVAKDARIADLEAQIAAMPPSQQAEVDEAAAAVNAIIEKLG